MPDEEDKTRIPQRPYLNAVIVVTDEVSVLEVDTSDGEHRFPVPLVEPVDGATVDEGRVHPTALSELAAGRTHSQHDVQVLLYALREKPLFKSTSYKHVRLHAIHTTMDDV